MNPMVAVLLVTSLGFAFLTFLRYKGGFEIYKSGNRKNLVYSSCLALLFLPISIVVDSEIGFPADLNILFPESLAFYPAIGFFVEIIFHVIPLSVLLFFLTPAFRIISHEWIIWFCVLIVALLEPYYQTAFMFGSDHYPMWSAVLVWFNLFLFNLTQLSIFRRYDFISMYSFRLVYYLFWHIGWGYFRLVLMY